MFDIYVDCVIVLPLLYLLVCFAQLAEFAAAKCVRATDNRGTTTTMMMRSLDLDLLHPIAVPTGVCFIICFMLIRMLIYLLNKYYFVKVFSVTTCRDHSKGPWLGSYPRD